LGVPARYGASLWLDALAGKVNAPASAVASKVVFRMDPVVERLMFSPGFRASKGGKSTSIDGCVALYGENAKTDSTIYRYSL
jgi:hypothetical protein